MTRLRGISGGLRDTGIMRINSLNAFTFETNLNTAILRFQEHPFIFYSFLIHQSPSNKYFSPGANIPRCLKLIFDILNLSQSLPRLGSQGMIQRVPFSGIIRLKNACYGGNEMGRGAETVGGKKGRPIIQE